MCPWPTGKAQFTTHELPQDTDTTALALTILHRDRAIAFPIMDEILRDCVNADGLVVVSPALFAFPVQRCSPQHPDIL